MNPEFNVAKETRKTLEGTLLQDFPLGKAVLWAPQPQATTEKTVNIIKTKNHLRGTRRL
jgi:hypothetical protein